MESDCQISGLALHVYFFWEYISCTPTALKVYNYWSSQNGSMIIMQLWSQQNTSMVLRVYSYHTRNHRKLPSTIHTDEVPACGNPLESPRFQKFWKLHLSLNNIFPPTWLQVLWMSATGWAVYATLWGLRHVRILSTWLDGSGFWWSVVGIIWGPLESNIYLVYKRYIYCQLGDYIYNLSQPFTLEAEPKSILTTWVITTNSTFPRSMSSWSVCRFSSHKSQTKNQVVWSLPSLKLTASLHLKNGWLEYSHVLFGAPALVFRGVYS